MSRSRINHPPWPRGHAVAALLALRLVLVAVPALVLLGVAAGVVAHAKGV